MSNYFEKYRVDMPAEPLWEGLVGADEYHSILDGIIFDSVLDNHQYKVSLFQTFLFHGSFGSGKSSFASAIAADCSKCGYVCIEIPGFAFYGDTEEKTAEKVTEFMEELKDKIFESDEIHYFIFIDDFSFIASSKLACRIFKYYKEHLDGIVNCVLVSTIESLEDVDSSVLKAFTVCRFENPSREERVEYWNRVIKKKFVPLITVELQIGDDLMADMTDGFSYGMLNRLTEMMMLYVRGNLKFSRSSDKIIITPELCESLKHKIIIPQSKPLEMPQIQPISYVPQTTAVPTAAAPETKTNDSAESQPVTEASEPVKTKPKKMNLEEYSATVDNENQQIKSTKASKSFVADALNDDFSFDDFSFDL